MTIAGPRLSFYVCDMRILVMSRALARSAPIVLAIALAMTIFPAIAVDTIVITGGITLDPDPATLWTISPNQKLDEERSNCYQATSAAECATIEGCQYSADPKGEHQSGSAVEACEPEGTIHPGDPSFIGWEGMKTPDAPPRMTVRVDGVSMSEPSTAFAIITSPGIAIDDFPPQGYAEVTPGQDTIELEVGSDLLGPGIHVVTVCINATECPGWNTTCSTCISKDEKIDWLDPDTGEVTDVNPSSPLVWISTPFAGHPSLWEDEVDRVTATIAVITYNMDWLAECWLEGEDKDNSANITLCGRGTLSPDICTFQSPTGDTAVEVALTLSYDQVDWYAGRYRLVCYINGVGGVGFISTILDTGFTVERRVPLTPLLFGNEEDGPVLPSPTPTAPGITEGPLVIPDGPPLTSTISCGDNRCDPGETVYNCCMDCGCPTGMACADNTCMPAPTPAPKGTDSTDVAAIGGLLLIAIVGYLVLRPRA